MSIPAVFGLGLIQEQGTWTPAASQIAAVDSDGISSYQFYDSSSSGAWVWADGSYQFAQTVVTVDDLDGVWFGGATNGNDETIWYRAVDTNGYASPWKYFTVEQISSDNTAPVVQTYSFSQQQGTWTEAANWVDAWDAAGIASYQLWDSSGDGAWIWANGGYQSAQTVIETTSLDGVWFGGATDGASETLYVRAMDPSGNLTEWTSFTATQGSSFANAEAQAMDAAGVANDTGILGDWAVV